MYTVTLSNGRSFPAEGGASILEAARAHGVALEYSCRTGRCGVCTAPVASGETIVLRGEESLSAQDAAAGRILTCCRAPASDVVLDVEDLGRLAGVETRTLPCRIAALDRVAVDLMRVTLRTPPKTDFTYLAGQYVDVIAAGIRRSYSLANAPRADGTLELLVRRMPAGALSYFWFDRAKAGDLLRFEGPLGTFFLRDVRPAHLLFLATGTGIAPVKAMLEEMAVRPDLAAGHRLSVYWGAREPDAFCWSPDDPALDVRFDRLITGSDRGWTGRRGRVPEAALADGLDLADTAVYACGSNAMIASAQQLFVAAGLPPKRFFSDAFVASS